MKNNHARHTAAVVAAFSTLLQSARPFEQDDDDDVLVEEEEEISLDEALREFNTSTGVYLVVLNDDHNSFEWVIACFMEILGHTSEQSEQLAYLIHTKGAATVKNGSSVDELLPFKVALCDRGLLAEIQGGEEA